MIGDGVGAEGFEGAGLVVEKESAVEAEVTGFGGIDEAGGVVGAHLEDHAVGEFAEGFSGHGSVEIIEGIDADEKMDSVATSFGEEFGELGAWGGGGVAGGEAEIVFVAEFF